MKRIDMIITTRDGREYDTALDLYLDEIDSMGNQSRIEWKLSDHEGEAYGRNSPYDEEEYRSAQRFAKYIVV